MFFRLSLRDSIFLTSLHRFDSSAGHACVCIFVYTNVQPFKCVPGLLQAPCSPLLRQISLKRQPRKPPLYTIYSRDAKKAIFFSRKCSKIDENDSFKPNKMCRKPCVLLTNNKIRHQASYIWRNPFAISLEGLWTYKRVTNCRATRKTRPRQTFFSQNSYSFVPRFPLLIEIR